jgi:hypothetical protein
MRRLALLLVTVPVAIGAGAFAQVALDAGGDDSGLKLSISPARQAIAPGQQASFSVTVRRRWGRVALRATRLPPGVRAEFRLANGKPSQVVPEGHDGAILTLAARRRLDPGSERVTVEARSRGRTRTRSARLALVPSRRRILTIEARPRHLSVLPGETAAYRVEIDGRVRTPVRLKVRGLPAGVRALWSPPGELSARRDEAALRLRAARNVKTGLHRVVISAPGRRTRRDAVVVVAVRESHDFSIAGDLGPPLYPGRSEPLELVLVNPNDFTIDVTALRVGIQPATSNEGCTGDNYAVAQYGGPYPLRLPPGSTRLGELVGDRSAWPQVRMLNLHRNQDACKNARVTLDYGGDARR